MSQRRERMAMTSPPRDEQRQPSQHNTSGRGSAFVAVGRPSLLKPMPRVQPLLLTKANVLQSVPNSLRCLQLHQEDPIAPPMAPSLFQKSISTSQTRAPEAGFLIAQDLADAPQSQKQPTSLSHLLLNEHMSCAASVPATQGSSSRLMPDAKSRAFPVVTVVPWLPWLPLMRGASLTNDAQQPHVAASTPTAEGMAQSDASQMPPAQRIVQHDWQTSETESLASTSTIDQEVTPMTMDEVRLVQAVYRKRSILGETTAKRKRRIRYKCKYCNLPKKDHKCIL